MATILIVDDHETNRTVLSRRLQEAGHRVVTAGDGMAALARVRDCAIDAVLLDVAMPGLSGIDVLRAIRMQSRTASLPVLMVTGLSDPGAAVEALAAGADGYIAKPFAMGDLTARIDRMLAHRPTGTIDPIALSISALRIEVERLIG